MQNVVSIDYLLYSGYCIKSLRNTTSCLHYRSWIWCLSPFNTRHKALDRRHDWLEVPLLINATKHKSWSCLRHWEIFKTVPLNVENREILLCSIFSWEENHFLNYLAVCVLTIKIKVLGACDFPPALPHQTLDFWYRNSSNCVLSPASASA